MEELRDILENAVSKIEDISCPPDDKDNNQHSSSSSSWNADCCLYHLVDMRCLLFSKMSRNSSILHKPHM